MECAIGKKQDSEWGICGKCISKLIYRLNILYHKKEIKRKQFFKDMRGQNRGCTLYISGKSFCVLWAICKLSRRLYCFVWGIQRKALADFVILFKKLIYVEGSGFKNEIVRALRGFTFWVSTRASPWTHWKRVIYSSFRPTAEMDTSIPTAFDHCF